jgi:osmotically inducible protein OsmC
MVRRNAHAVWQGTVRDGRGVLATAGRALNDMPYSFNTRFGDEAGTSPEELIAAAHAGCYSMALSWFLGAAGLTPRRIETHAQVSVESSGASWSVVAVRLMVTASAPGAADADFQRLAEQARAGCLVTRMLDAAIAVTLEARLDAE